jgi:hypothetical protein
MTHPLLYVKSKGGEYFSVEKFIAYLAYACVHAMLIFVTTYLCAEKNGMQPSGKNLGLVLSGHLAYGTCILIVNMVILMRFHSYTGWGEGMAFGMILMYFTLMYLEGFVGL